MMHASLAVAAAAIAGGLWWWTRRSDPAAAAPVAPPALALPAGALPRHEVLALAERTVSQFRLPAAVPMLVTMAWVESSFRPAVIGDDGTSFGLLQVSRSTATWLAGDLHYSGFGGQLSNADLLRPEVSMYLGAAYVAWLGRYRGIARSEEWIVRAYNGGPGWDLPADHPSWQTRNRALVLSNTARHWDRYRAAKRALGFA